MNKIHWLVICFVASIGSSFPAAAGSAWQVDESNLIEETKNHSSQWPANANGDLPLGGLFYGNAQAGTATTNSKISIESSRRFRAQRTGTVDSFRFHNRVLSNKDIKSKCSRSGKDSAWCACKDAGLDAYTCGYTIGSSYSVGNGGLIVVQVVPDDGSGFPDESTVLGFSEAFVPLELSKSSSSHYVTLPFTQSATIEAGQVYHLLFKNLNPPTNCALSKVSLTKAASCPKNQGAISINGIYDKNSPSSTGRWGPMYGTKGAASLYRDASSNEWQVFDKGLSFYELHYSDGVAVGESYHALDALKAGQNEIQGNTLARQRFTVEQENRNVTGVWVNHGLGKLADGSTARVTLVDDNDSVLANGELSASTHCMEQAISKCRDWGYVDFKTTVPLDTGAEYKLEIRAGDTAGFLLSAYRSLEAHGFDDRNNWDGARAEVSTNGGRSWSKWSKASGKNRDLPVLFTLEGMPLQLP